MQTIAVKPGAARGHRLGAHLGVGFMMVGAPLGMADDHRHGAGILEHFGGDIAGMGAGRLGMAILPADRHRGAARGGGKVARSGWPAGRPSDRP